MTYFTPRLVLDASPLLPLQLPFQDLPRGQSGPSLLQDGVGSYLAGPCPALVLPPPPACFPACLRGRSLTTLALVRSAGLPMLVAVTLSSAFHDSSQCLSPSPHRTASLSFTLLPDGAFVGTQNAVLTLSYTVPFPCQPLPTAYAEM